MTFEPGHGIRGNPLGTSAAQRRLSKSFALRVRELVDFDDVINRLQKMAQGVDPVTGTAIDDKGQRDAMRILLERGLGQPAQHVVVDAEIRQELIATTPRDARPTMSIDEINERRRALRERGIKPKIIDVESQPKLTEGSGTDDE